MIIYIVWQALISRNSHDNQFYEKHATVKRNKLRNTSIPIIENVNLCSKVLYRIDLLIVIISVDNHFLDRQSIRETFGAVADSTLTMNVHSQRLFVIGYGIESISEEISNEAASEEDLLYLSIDDKSATLKELYAYQWLSKHCPNVTYTFKTEDDLFINTLLLQELIRELKTEPQNFQGRFLHNVSIDNMLLTRLGSQTFLYGWAFQPGKPVRNETVKLFYVDWKEYPFELYPRYCSGFGYLMDDKTRDLLVNEGLKQKQPFRFADIYLTGMIPEKLNFVCDILPFGYYQGTNEICQKMLIDIHKIPPLLVCSTGRHVEQNVFTDYYRSWNILKQIYADKL
ncbi:unnamed protein product [Didymodactylos carnosus]|uniref:Hexosyltransferase n=1 Tax=Didymodactylos carnosus TaxID=1234261 RepID=A0A813Q0D2_9BILA|nr:unnamed protein product [Didymodactylos carnosus]CAF0759495.1 unnamed protein product [Didymodactylos carnosus]CAF3533854.1 unnamed protein product [Didymodactylos carnosus]CAF3540179.1 unnamed protein product [Didymodactylos carnosus]